MPAAFAGASVRAMPCRATSMPTEGTRPPVDDPSNTVVNGLWATAVARCAAARCGRGPAMPQWLPMVPRMPLLMTAPNVFTGWLEKVAEAV